MLPASKNESGSVPKIMPLGVLDKVYAPVEAREVTGSCSGNAANCREFNGKSRASFWKRR